MEKRNKSLIVTTLVTDNYYQHYLPIFIYTMRMSNPNCLIKTFIKGRTDSLNIEAFDYLHEKGIYFDMPIELPFEEYPDNISVPNALRFLIDESNYGNNNVFITDADFVFFPHDPAIDKYYEYKLKKWGECYWGRRGFKRILGTDTKTKRIAAGGFLATPDWFSATRGSRQAMREKLISGKIGKVREDDEIMLWDICAGSGLNCPTKKGNKIKKKYKELHLGDFKFYHRWTSTNKMRRKINRGNYYKWHRLEEGGIWLGLTQILSKCKEINQVITNVREYMSLRKGEKLEN